MKCFHSVPFNETIRSHTISQLEKSMQLYAFLDIASNPPDPIHFNPPVDLMKFFEYVRTEKFGSDFHFHHTLRYKGYLQCTPHQSTKTRSLFQKISAYIEDLH